MPRKEPLAIFNESVIPPFVVTASNSWIIVPTSGFYHCTVTVLFNGDWVLVQGAKFFYCL